MPAGVGVSSCREWLLLSSECIWKVRSLARSLAGRQAAWGAGAFAIDKLSSNLSNFRLCQSCLAATLNLPEAPASTEEEEEEEELQLCTLLCYLASGLCRGVRGWPMFTPSCVEGCLLWRSCLRLREHLSIYLSCGAFLFVHGGFLKKQGAGKGGTVGNLARVRGGCNRERERERFESKALEGGRKTRRMFLPLLASSTTLM